MTPATHPILMIAVPAPVAPLTTLLSVTERDMAMLWNPPIGRSWAGAGTTRRIDLHGNDRFAQLRRSIDELWPTVRAVSFPGVPLPTTRLFGGFSFDTGTHGEPWAEFGDGCFTLPRWVYERWGDQATLTLAVSGEGRTGSLWHHEVLVELGTILDALQNNEGRTFETQRSGSIARSALEQLPFEEWEKFIQRVCGTLREGSLRKIVAARRCRVRGPALDSDVATFERLTLEPDCTTFCFRRARSSFVGASPERLLEKTGVSLSTHALAGTIRSTGSLFPQQSVQSRVLLSSEKDSIEHSHVVVSITDALHALSEGLDFPSGPDVRKVRNIIHLNTPIKATLKAQTSVADLLAVLHPTPAVGGLPTREAATWLVENEPLSRGWYAGGVGWLDALGDGVINVAIRSGVVAEGEAFIYTGAGIVAQSNPQSEYDETALKQEPLLRALDVED